MALVSRTRTLFLPAAAALISQGVVIGLFSLLGIYDKTLWREPSFSPPVYLLFWLALVPIGSLGAWLSRRAGGSVLERILAALAMVLGKLAGYVVFLPAVLLISGKASLHFVYGGLDFILLKYIIVPGCALSMGALPFLGQGRRKGTEKSAG